MIFSSASRLGPTLFVIFSYGLGSIPTGYWLGKLWKGIDIRRLGSGNLGATNVFRVLGKGPGAFTLAIDILKGMIPVLWAQHLYPDSQKIVIASGLAAIVGHTTSPFVGFRGGKGVATSAGVFGALLPIPSAIAFVTFMISLMISRMVSASSMIAAIVLTVATFTLSRTPLLAYTTAAVASLVIWKHRTNIQRIFAGTEPRIGMKGPV